MTPRSTNLFYRTLALATVLLAVLSQQATAQCVPVRDPRAANAPTYRPQPAFLCLASGAPATGTFTLNFNGSASNFFVDWGDGNTQTITGPTSNATHVYTTSGTHTYRVWFSGCTTDTVIGDYINDYNTTVPGIGFITPPAGYTNKRCVPEVLTMNNASPGMNGFTQFVIYWGDLAIDTVDYRSYRQDISHTYMPFTTGCNVKISVIYHNLCGATPGGLNPTAVYGEYYFMDRDSARVDPAEVILCAPTDVTINDVSKLNCLDSLGRVLSWTATHGFAAPLPYPGDGVFRPYAGPGNRTMNIPAAAFYPISPDSTYRLKMVIKNQCGPDSAYATIKIVAPKHPIFAVVNDNTCPGEVMNFTNSTPNPSGVQTYRWDWGDGNTEVNGASTVGHAFVLGGAYWVKLYSVINGYNGQVCYQVDSIQVHVKKTVSAILDASPLRGCDTLTVTAYNHSRNLTGVVWQGWELGGSPLITAGSGYLPTIPGSNPAVAQVVSTNPADSSAIIHYNTYGKYTIKLRASSGTCPPSVDQAVVQIFPTPTVRFRIPDVRVCLGQGIVIRDSSRVIPTAQRSLPSDWRDIAWRLDYGDGHVDTSTANVTGNFNSPGASGRVSTHVYTAPGTYWVKLTVHTPYSCTKTDSIRVQVQPGVLPSFLIRQDRCDPSAITVINTSDKDTAKYEFTFSRAGVPYTIITHAVKDSFNVRLPFAGPSDTTFYNVVLRAVVGVPGDTCSVSTSPSLIKVTAAAVALFSNSVNDGCTPLSGVQFFNNSYNIPSGGGYTYSWSFGNGNTFFGDTPPLQNYINNGLVNQRDTVRLTLTSPLGCTFKTFKEIIVYPAPNVQIVAPDTVCAGASITFSATGNGLAQYTWGFADLDGTTSAQPLPTRTFPNAGFVPQTHNVTLTVQTASGCFATTNNNITVMPLPVAGFTPSALEICGNAPATLVFDAGAGSTGATYYHWDFGDGQPAVYDSTAPVAVHGFPGNNGIVDQTYTVTLTARSAFGCPSLPATRVITLHPAVRAIFVADTNKVCAPLAVNFANIGYRPGVTYTWYIKTAASAGMGAPFGANRPSGSFSYTFTNPGNQAALPYEVTLVATGAGTFPVCADTLRDTVTVYGRPAADFTLLTDPASGCAPVLGIISPTPDSLAASYVWDFGDATPPAATPGPTGQAHLYDNATNIAQTYTVTLTVNSLHNCPAVKTATLTVKPVPVAAFTIDDSLGCSPVSVRVTDQSSPATDNVTWLVNGAPYSFDRQPAAPFVFTSTSATDTTVYAIRQVARGVGNACVDTSAPRFIRVLPKPSVVLSAHPLAGCSPFTTTLSLGGSMGGASAYWSVKPPASTVYTRFDTTAGADSLTQNLLNPTAADQVYTYKALVVSQGGCADSATVAATVSPGIIADAQALPDTIGCAPFTVTFNNLTSSPAANSFSWRVDGVERSASPLQFQYRFDNPSATRDTVYVVTLVASNVSSGCPSVKTIRIRVKPTPVADFAMSLSPASACSPVRVGFAYVGAAGAVRYQWLLAPADTFNTAIDTAFNRLYVNSGSQPATRTVRLTATSAYGCQAVAEHPLTINPGVFAALTQSANLGCSPLPVVFNNASSVGADVLEWIVDGVSRGNGQQLAYTFTNGTVAPITFSIKLAVRNSLAPACADTAYATVTVNPTPQVDGLAAMPTIGCSPLNAQLSTTATGATTYRWDFADGTAFDSSAAALAHTFLNIGSLQDRAYRVSVIGANAYGCADSAQVQVTVHPGSRAIIANADSVGCTPLRSQLIGSSSVNANVFTWNFGDGTPPAYVANPVHVFANPSDTVVRYRVQLIATRSGGFCPDTTYSIVTVNPVPQVRFTPQDTAGCQPLHVRYRGSATAGATLSWQLQSLDGTGIYVGNTVDTTYTNANPANMPVQVALTATNAFGCAATASGTTVVGPAVQAALSASIDAGCAPLRVRFTNASAPGTRAAWYVNGTPASQANGGFAYTFLNTGTRDTTYTVSMVVFNPASAGCQDTAYQTITVYPRPNAGSIFADPTQGCSPLLVELSGSATGAVSYHWEMGDGQGFDTTAQTISHAFVNTSAALTQTFRVSQVAISSHGCLDTAKTAISVRPGVQAVFTVSDSTGCTPLGVVFNAGGSYNANLFTWDFGDGQGTSNARQPFYQYFNQTDTAQAFTITLTADKAGVGCPSVAQHTVTVWPQPTVSFTPGDTAGCQPFAVRFASTGHGADSLVWTFASPAGFGQIAGPAVIDTVFTNQASAIAETRVTLSGYNSYGCAASADHKVQALPFTQAGFDVNADSACSPFRLRAANLASAGSRVQWYINGTPVSGQTGNLSAVLYNFSDRDSIVQIMQVAQNTLAPSCQDTMRHTVVVVARPHANAILADPAQGCSPLLVELSGTATGGVSYHWDMADGTSFDTTSQTISHLFENFSQVGPRTFNVREVVINYFGCTDTTSTPISVRPNVRAGIGVAVDSGCAPLGIQLSSAPSVNANLFTWTFGDSTSGSSAAEPYHVFENNSDTIRHYLVRLIADKNGIGCPDEAVRTITVYPHPTAAFTPPDSAGCQPFVVHIQSTSLRADSLLWTITRDTLTSVYLNQTGIDTVLTNASADMQETTITLRTANSYGCTAEATGHLRVNPAVAAGFTQTADSGCSPLPITFTPQTATGNRVAWYVNGQLLSQNPATFSYTFTAAGTQDSTYTVMQVAQSRFDGACADTLRHTIKVFGRPQAGAVFADPQTGCSPMLSELTGSPTGATSYRWDFADGTAFDTAATVVSHVFINPALTGDATYNALFIAINAHGCRDTARQPITVRPGVTAAFSVSDSAGCAPLGVQFANASTNADLFQWDFGDGSAPGFQRNPYRVFENVSDSIEHHLVRLVADKNGVGCPATATRLITVYPHPHAEFIPLDTAGCQPFAVHLESRATLADSLTWSFRSAAGTTTYLGRASIDTVFANPTATVQPTQATLTVTTRNGCAASATHTLTAYPFVQAGIAASADSGCSPLTVRFDNLSALGNLVSWSVDGAYAGNNGQGLTYTFVNQSGRDSIFTVQLVARHPQAAGCEDTIRKQIRVFAKPIAGLLLATPDQGCSPLAAVITGEAQGAATYRFSFGDNAPDTTLAVQSAAHLYGNATPVTQTYTVGMIAISTHGCADTTTAPIQVKPRITADVAVLTPEGCTPLQGLFSGAGSLNANRYTWDFGDGSAPSGQQNPVHPYRNLGDSTLHYTVRLIADRQNVGCPDTAYGRIAVYPQPQAAFVANATESCSPMALHLDNQSTGQGISTLWTFTDGVLTDTLRTASPIDTAIANATPQRKTVWVQADVTSQYGCAATQRQPVYINPSILAHFERPATGCSPLAIAFSNTSRNVDEIYEWDFGDGSAHSMDVAPRHLFRYTGLGDTAYIVRLTARSSPALQPVCESVYTDTVRVSGRPVAQFAFTPDDIVRLPDNHVTIRNTTPFESTWRYAWSFGDGSTDTISAPEFTHTLTGLYQALTDTAINVQLIAGVGTTCPDTVRMPLYIKPVKPVADFGPEASGCAPVDVTFANNSRWANQYYWQFGDGSTSTEQNPSHRYTRPGSYNVRLTVYGPGGSDTLERADIITVYEVPSARFTVFPRTPLNIPEDKLTGIVTDPQPGNTYLWQFGDGQTSTAEEPQHGYDNPGAYQVILTVTSEHGCIETDTGKTSIDVRNGGTLSVPNAFMPNPNNPGDGTIDPGTKSETENFYPFTIGVVSIDLQIYTRWGECIFKSTTLNKGWNGYYQGRLCQSDVYVYKIEARLANGELRRKMGDVTLIR